MPIKSVNTFNQANGSNSEGPYSLEFDSTGADQDVLTVGSDAFLKIEDAPVSGKQLTLTDQTTEVSLPITAGEHSAAVHYEAGAENSVWTLSGTQYGTLSTPSSSTSVTINYASSTAATQMELNNLVIIEIDGTITIPGGASVTVDGVATDVAVLDGTQTEVIVTTSTGTFTDVGTGFIGKMYSQVFSDQSYIFDSGSTIEEVSEENPANVVTFTNVVEGDWIQADGTMQLMLDDVYSDETDYDNAFGTGNLIVGVDSREIKRWNAALYFSGQQYLDFTTQLVDNDGNYLVDDDGDYLTI